MANSRLEPLLREAHARLARGDFAAAQSYCLNALGIADREPRVLSLLGQALFAQGKHEEAVRVFNALTLIEPAEAKHWQNLAAALRPTKQYDLAIAAFDRALRLAPPSATLLYNLGVLQMERCDYNAAYLALRDSVKLAPNDAKSRWGFAQCCYDILALEESLETLQHWRGFVGLDVDLTVRIVFLLVMMGASDQAALAIEELRVNPPRRGPAAVAFATILERMHLLEEAAALMTSIESDRSFDTDPDMLLISSIVAERQGRRVAAREKLTAALAHHSEFVHRHHLLFRLAKVEDSLGNYSEAFAAATEAHRSKVEFIERAVGRTPQQESRILARAVRSCDAADVASWTQASPPREKSPVFVVGFPRSGTTLLEQVLDAHPALHSMDEQPFVVRAYEEVIDCGIQYPDQLGNLSDVQLENLRARYWERVAAKVALAPGERLVDKNPLNMNMLPLIQRLFPNASIILTIRHPYDVLLSCFMQNFRAPELALLCRDLPTLANAYDVTFGFWDSQRVILRPVVHELHYEQLAANLEREVARLADFLQLPMHEAMLAPAERARAKGFVSTPSYAQILEPVTTKAVGRWQHYQQHFEPVMPVLEPWLARWGYATAAPVK